MRGWLTPLVGFALGLGGLANAHADTKSATPCANYADTNGNGLVRKIRAVSIGATAVRFCTGKDCWSFDRATSVVSSIAPLPDPPAVTPATHATADTTRVQFCPPKSKCATFPIKVKTPAATVLAQINDAGTLGAVSYRGAAEPDNPKYGPSLILAFDLTAKKARGQVDGETVAVFGHAFLVDHERLYDAVLKPIGRLVTRDEGATAIPSTELIAVHDEARGEVVLQDTQTGTVRAHLSLGPSAKSGVYFDFTATPDGKTLVAIGTVAAEGQIVVVDVANAKVVGRGAAKVCAPGSFRME